MKRSVHTANSSSNETINHNHSPKRSCTEKISTKNSAASASPIDNISCSLVSSSTSTAEMSLIEENIQKLMVMGFPNEEIIRKALNKADNDVNEAVTYLTDPNFGHDDLLLNSNEIMAPPLIGPLTREQLEQQQQQQIILSSNPLASTTTDEQDSNSFTTSAFLDLETKVYGDNWSIPYKRDEVLGRCLLSATKLALAGSADKDEHCKKFMEDLIPDAFRKLQCSHHVNNWGVEVQNGVFDMVELLIDLIAARLSYSPVPVELLETLAILFDHDSQFHRKHKSKPYDRTLYDKQLGERVLAFSPGTTFSGYNRNEPYGWLCQIINRFVSKDGLVHLKQQFQSEQPLNAQEYKGLFAPFANCLDFIHKDKYQELFNEHVEQALEYVKNLKEEDFKAKSTSSIFDLLSTLRKICVVIWTNRVHQVEELHLNLLLKMVALSNFNAKMNSLKELAKMIEASTSAIVSVSKSSIHRDIISEWIIVNSVLSKALEGNIDQNQYVDKVRTLLDFIAPRILKEDIDTIWLMQHGRSLVAVDHLFTLIASAAAKFTLEQLNHLIALIYNSWKIETILIQEKLIELLGAIGRECQKESAARVLEVLWNMAHEERLTRSMLDHILHCHLRVFSEGRSSSETLKRDYCLKCMDDLQQKQGWLVPAIKHLYELLRHDQNSTFKRSDVDLVSLLVSKHDLILALIQSLSTCQKEVWTKTRGHVTVDTLVDGRFTHEESIKSHLDLLSFLLKKGNLYLIFKRSEELWDTLIANDNVSSFDRELGLDWFVNCVEDLNRDSQIDLFQRRVSTLDPIHLSPKGYACFKLYFERCNNIDRSYSNKVSTYMSSSSNDSTVNLQGVNELWNIILCVDDENLANDATRFLLDLYYGKHRQRTSNRPAVQSLHECFLKEVYSRLNVLLSSAVPPVDSTNCEEFYRNLKNFAEQIFSSTNSSIVSISHELWLQKIERLLMITEEYIYIVEAEASPWSHIASFSGLEYQIEIVLGETGKANLPYDIVVVHSNDTLESLRTRLATFYKVSPSDVHLSICNSRPLPQTYDHSPSISNAIALPSSNSSSSTSSSNNVLGLWLNSKYLYQLQIHPGTIVYVKILGSSFNQPTKSSNSEPIRLYLNRSTRSNNVDSVSRSNPSDMLGENVKFYDILYQLSYLNQMQIHQRIRNLLRLMPSDVRIVDLLDNVSIRAATVSTSERRQSTENATNSNQILNPRQAIERILNFHECSFVQILYNLEILSSKISPLSSNIGIQQSSRLFRQDFIDQSCVKILFQSLQTFHQLINDDHEYFLGEEMMILILQLIQHLLCGSTSNDDLITTNSSRSTSPIAVAANDVLMDTIDFDFQPTIEFLSFDEFVEQIQQLIFAAWAAAAGNIRLQAQNLTIKEQVKLDRHALLQKINSNVFSKTNSKNSTSSDSSTNSINSKIVQFGVCVRKDSILPLDSVIAEKLIEILTFAFEKRREFLSTFLVQPFFADFILEILIGTSSREIRRSTLKNLVRLCKMENPPCDIRAMIHQILLRARLPLWPSSTIGTRGTNQKLLGQSIEYFDLRCFLTSKLCQTTQNLLNINARQLLDEEFYWLTNFTVSTMSNELRLIDNTLFIGHLRLIRTLLTCENVNKNEIGEEFIRLLIDEFLFPASKTIFSPEEKNETSNNVVPEPKCSTSESRQAAYDVLVELVRNCRSNLKIVVEDLINLHHRPRIEKQTEWEFMPQVNPRSTCGLVGLYNGGATCYMNSILQQLFMIPQISEHILNVHDDSSNIDSTLFYQLQQVFGHLMESKTQYYSPESLWKVFRLWGQEINIREQQDAFDFFTALTDQIDEYLKSIKHEEIFRKQFEGIFCNQMICTNGCRHRYEGEERFMALNVAVKVESLNESLNQFVKGELLDGNNAYFCAKCQEKRTTIKRLCIKKLPPLLCIQMKRFGFDWENNRALKFDDYFKFPLILNMEPYTVDGVNKRESFVDHDDVEPKISSSTSTINYELIGIVIHSGQANAGHYYSFIKDIRRRSTKSEGQWYRFNDTTVEEIQLTEQILEEECFGGNFRVQKENSNTNEERTRFWNAYMLVYRCIEPSKLLPPPSFVHRSLSNVPIRISQRDSLSQLADLVSQSENSDLFKVENASIPSSVSVCVKEENLEFVKNRDTFCDDYFQFVFKLCRVCFDEIDLPLDIELIEIENVETSFDLSTKLALNFLFNTHLRTHRRLRQNSLEQWIQLLAKLFLKSSSTCLIFYEMIFERGENGLKHFLLDCPIDEIRSAFQQICEQVLSATYWHFVDRSPQIVENDQNETLIVHLTDQPNRPFNLIQPSENKLSKALKMFVEQLISLLDKSVVEQVKHSQAFFQLISSFSKMNRDAIEFLFQQNVFSRLMNFLLGENLENRRWNSAQAKEFGIIHEIIASLVLFVDPKRNELNEEMKTFFFGKSSTRYLKEISYAVQEVSTSHLTRTFSLLEVLAEENRNFSLQLIRILLQAILQAHTNDLKAILKLFSHILLIEDSIQIVRLQFAFEGSMENGSGDQNSTNFNGLYAILRTNIDNEQRRAYQLVKFIINLSNQNEHCKNYFTSTTNQWETAINWLKQQMQTTWQWSPAPNVSNEDNDTRAFQRTRSAQFTLEQAQSLLERTIPSTTTEMMEFNDTQPTTTNENN